MDGTIPPVARRFGNVLGELDMARRMLLLVAVIIAGCQSAGTPTAIPTQAQAATSSPIAATPAATATKPVTLPRTVDVPLDGTCENENVSCFGKLEAGKVYTTKVFTPAMSFAVPTSDWVNPGETGGDIGIFSTRDVGDVIMFFRDARSADKAVGATVTDIAGWLASNHQLTVTPAKPAKIGGLTGVSMDIRIAPGATSTDPGCPVQACVTMLRGDDPVANDPYQWHWDWGLAGTEASRMYLLDGPDTVVAIFVDSLDGKTFDSITAAFDQMTPKLSFAGS
jgi:hypothetical protein